MASTPFLQNERRSSSRPFSTAEEIETLPNVRLALPQSIHPFIDVAFKPIDASTIDALLLREFLCNNNPRCIKRLDFVNVDDAITDLLLNAILSVVQRTSYILLPRTTEQLNRSAIGLSWVIAPSLLLLNKPKHVMLLSIPSKQTKRLYFGITMSGLISHLPWLEIRIWVGRIQMMVVLMMVCPSMISPQYYRGTTLDHI